MKKVIEWLKKSNRFKHIAGGIFIGLLAYDFTCSFYAAVMSAACLEYKDRAYGGKWDWINFGLVVGGSLVGTFIRYLIIAAL